MRSFKHKGLVEVRGTDFARVCGEARVELPQMAVARTLTVEGHTVRLCNIEVRLGSVLLGTILAQGNFHREFEVVPECGTLLVLRIMKSHRSLLHRGRKHVVDTSGESIVHLRRILVDGEPMIDFSEGAGCFFPRLSTKDSGMGLNIIGFFRHAFGVGEAARCSARAADAARIPTAIIPCKIGTDSAAVDETWTPRFRDENPYPINLFHLDAPQTALIDQCHGGEFRKSRYNVGYWAWELPEFPDAWLSNFSYLDEVWVPSRFVQESVGAKSPVPVLVMPHAVEPPAPLSTTRATLGLPEDDLLFLTVFDLSSTQARKNPQAALKAFRRAFPDPRGVRLVVKTQGGDPGGRETESLRMAISETPGAVLIHRAMSRAELGALESACDCFVSLHRAEGFGMALAECMLAGRPVIATGWSGNLEFMTPENSCLVNHRLVEIEQTIGPYKRGQRWAEPDIEHAAALMRELADNPARREEIGRAGQASVREYLAPHRIGELYARRLKALYHWI